MIKGIDISHLDNINWDTISPDFQFIWCKGSEGYTEHDPLFGYRWNLLKSTNLIYGAYHYLLPNDTAQAQADNFLALGIDFSQPNILPPCVDCEENGLTIELITEWINIIQEATGCRVVIYSYPSFLSDNLKNHAWDNPLWIAAYQLEPPTKLGGFKTWIMWQNSQYGTQQGAMTGGNLDMDYFNGSLDDLKNFSKYKQKPVS